MKYINKLENYKSKLGLLETEIAIKYVKDTFEKELALELNLTRVSAPLFVYPESGLNDYLNGFERVVKFDVLDIKKDVEIVQSLAKWKRNSLKKYNFEAETGLYTDMNAIRRDEELDAIHSIYVDQWDWEKIIIESERTTSYLESVVRKIYKVIKTTLDKVNKKFSVLSATLPLDIFFIDSEDLLKMYPNNTPKERENLITKKYGAVFIKGIGDKLSNGMPHDGRAADYDDWSLDGDLLFYHEVLDCALEISSMGIRVDSEALLKQIEKSKKHERLQLDYHKLILVGELPLSIGGGIGQSRLCQLLLGRAHIGEVQASYWDKQTVKECEELGIELL